MKRVISVAALLTFAVTAQANETWSGLWRNADQRGEVLMQHGDSASAAKVYVDPRRKAYAELKSADYASAIHDYSAFGDSESKYNQGNAFAYEGNLSAAIDAYDKALKLDPQNRDARHNRDLVANAMKKGPPQPQSQDGGQSKNEKQSGQAGKNQSDGAKNQEKDGDQKGQAKKNGAGDEQSQNDKQPSGQNPDQGAGSQKTPKNGNQEGQAQSGQKDSADGKNGRNGNGTGNDASKVQEQSKPTNDRQAGGVANPAHPEDHQRPGNSPAQQGAQQQDKQQTGQQSPAGTNKQESDSQPGKDTDDAKQALRDASAGLGTAKQGAALGKATANDVKNGVPQADVLPLTEKQIAQEQWLRSIPDDPGGLLRRKFLIEHLRRQQKEQP